MALSQLGQAAAPDGLHDPDRNVVLPEQFHLGLGILEGPVQVVELDLAELHVVPVSLQEAAHHRHAGVGGEAQALDPARGLLLLEVGIDAVLGVQIGVDVHFADVVKEVEIEIVHLALFQLLLENLFHLAHVVQAVAGELGG